MLDNTGVQYGLAALNAGQITPAQFAALNAGVGGYDHTGAPDPDPHGRRPARAERRVRATTWSTARGWACAPRRSSTSARTSTWPARSADIHTAELSYVMRERLIKANGTAANQVIIETAPDPAQAGAAAAYELDAMDRWLTAIGDDASHRDKAAKVVANKPADLGDGCYTSPTERIVEPLTYPAAGRCGALYPIAANPRLVAGSDLSMNDAQVPH